MIFMNTVLAQIFLQVLSRHSTDYQIWYFVFWLSMFIYIFIYLLSRWLDSIATTKNWSHLHLLFCPNYWRGNAEQCSLLWVKNKTIQWIDKNRYMDCIVAFYRLVYAILHFDFDSVLFALCCSWKLSKCETQTPLEALIMLSSIIRPTACMGHTHRGNLAIPCPFIVKINPTRINYIWSNQIKCSLGLNVSYMTMI